MGYVFVSATKLIDMILVRFVAVCCRRLLSLMFYLCSVILSPSANRLPLSLVESITVEWVFQLWPKC